MSWAVDSWTEVEARAVMLGLTARVGGPDSILDLDSRHFLALLEGILRETDERRKQLDDIYAASRPVVKTPTSRRERNREIARISSLFGG